MTWSDVRRAERNKTEDETDIHIIDDETWKRVVASGTRINKPKHPRPEVFLREIPQLELEDFNDFLLKKSRKKSFELKFGLSLFNFFQEKNSEVPEIGDDDQDEEEELSNFDEGEDDGKDTEVEPTPLFMSNIREEVLVNRIRLDFVSKAIKGNTYANLYKQDFMSVIGPEVFDRATKLPKVISFTKVTRRADLRSSASLPVFPESKGRSKKRINFDNDSTGREELSSNMDIVFDSEKERQFEKNTAIFLRKSHDSESNSMDEKVVSITDGVDIKNPFKPPGNEKQNRDNSKAKNSVPLSQKHEKAGERTAKVLPESQKPDDDLPENQKNQQPCPPFIRKRRIYIRRKGKRKFPDICENDPMDNDECLDECNSRSTLSASVTDSENEDSETDLSSMKSNCSAKHAYKTYPRNEQIYFLTELLQKPLIEVLIAYYDLKNEVYRKEKGHDLRNLDSRFLDSDCHLKSYQDLIDSFESERKKTWKSKVLETAGIYTDIKNKSPSRLSNLNLLRKDYALRRLLKSGFLLLGSKESWIKRRGNSKLHKNDSDLKPRDKSFPIVLFDDQNCQKQSQNSSFFSAMTDNLSRSYVSNDFISKAEPKLEIKSSPSVDVICKKSGSQIYSKPSSFSNTEVLYSVTNLGDGSENSQQLDFSENAELTPTKSTSSAYNSLSDRESDESFSLYYSKAADLASPLMDMKRFIYPDHIHYSYKHVKKKGFDVDITGGLPLLVRESLTMNTGLEMKNVAGSTGPELVITRRPMDLSFAKTNAFVEWQNNDQYETDPNITEFSKKNKNTGTQKTGNVLKKDKNPTGFKVKKEKKSKCKKSSNDFKHLHSVKDRLLIEKLVKMHLRRSGREHNQSSDFERERTPVQISSTQLHSNKGRISSTYNPAIYLQENRTRTEKKKVDTQEERTKDMFARLEREALLQNRNVIKTHGSLRRK